MQNGIAVRDLTPSDAEDLVALFRRCYGDAYGVAAFYDAPELVKQIEGKRLRSVVVTHEGRLVGHMGITIRHTDSLACETGNTVVHPETRGRGLLRMLAVALHERVQREGFVGYVHYPTTAHEIMQRSSVAGGGKETGVMLAYIAATHTNAASSQQPGRLAATVVYQPIQLMPSRSVCLPSRYREILREIYDALRFERAEYDRQPAHPNDVSATLNVDFNPRRASLHLFLRAPGSGLHSRIDDAMKEHQPYVTYMDVPLDDPAVDSTIDVLNNLGFRYCALLPEFAHVDVLRMQRLGAARAEDLEPNVINEDAIRMCAFIRADT